ncbi:MAG: hypothetical protein E7374_00550 [Clostridiales bacterium]|nr:hypothetical protein [Clostridiales bacterium]
MFNFDKIGEKIKTLAVVFSIIGVSVSIVFGIHTLFKNAPLGILIIIIGSFCSWISSFFIYGYGELINKTTEIAKNTKQGIKIEIESDKK